MSDAICNIMPNRTRNIGNLEPTHRYIRFLPKSKYQLDALNEHYTIFNFPLDNIPNTLNDKDLTDVRSNPNEPYMYAMVEYDKELPDSIEWSLLDTFFNPYCSKLCSDNRDLADAIMEEAYKLSYNIENTTRAAISTWIPHGTIRVWDDVAARYVPVEGVRVYCSNSLMIDTQGAITDQNGHFMSNVSFVDDVTYMIQWKDAEWAIRFGVLDPAISISTVKPNAFNVDIYKTDKSNYYAATTFRAAQYYWHYGPLYHNITSPTMDEQVQIYCYDEISADDGSYGYFWHGFMDETDPDIELWCKNKTTDQIIRYTSHELAHAAHYANAGRTQYNNTHIVVRESWTTLIEYLLSEGLYEYVDTRLGTQCIDSLFDTYTWCDEWLCYIEYSPNSFNQQMWSYMTPSTTSFYTPMFIDIYDNLNQRMWYTDIEPLPATIVSKIPNDRIWLNDLEWIEDCVFSKRTVNGVREELLEYNNDADLGIPVEDINSLFEFYLQIDDTE